MEGKFHPTFLIIASPTTSPQRQAILTLFRGNARIDAVAIVCFVEVKLHATVPVLRVGTETGRLFDSGRFLESRALGEMNKTGHDKNDSKDEKLHYKRLITKRIKREFGFLNQDMFLFPSV